MNRPRAEAIAALKEELAEGLGSAQVRDDEEVRTSFASDESDMGEFRPDLVVHPRTAQEVSLVLRRSFARGVPVTPCGARSGKSGGSLPLEGGVAMSLERMN